MTLIFLSTNEAMRTAGMALAGVCENPAADIRQIFGYLSFKRGASLLLTRRTASCSETASQFGDIPNVSWQKTKAITRHNGSGLRGFVKSGNALGGRSIIATFIVYINKFFPQIIRFFGSIVTLPVLRAKSRLFLPVAGNKLAREGTLSPCRMS